MIFSKSEEQGKGKVKPVGYFAGIPRQGMLDMIHLFLYSNSISFEESSARLAQYFSEFIVLKSDIIGEIIKKMNHKADALIIEFFDRPIHVKYNGFTMNCFIYTFDKEALRYGLQILDLYYPFQLKTDPIDLKKTGYTIVAHTAISRNTVPDIAYVHMDYQDWTAIGYHFVILMDGTTVYTRPLTAVGAHCWGYNNSIGICFSRNLNESHLTETEIHSFNMLVSFLNKYYPIGDIMGHVLAQLNIIGGFLVRDAEQNRQKIFLYRQEIDVADKITQMMDDCFIGRNTRREYLKQKILDALDNNQDILNKDVITGQGKKTLGNLIDGIKDCPGKYFAFELYQYSIQKLKVA